MKGWFERKQNKGFRNKNNERLYFYGREFCFVGNCNYSLM